MEEKQFLPPVDFQIKVEVFPNELVAQIFIEAPKNNGLDVTKDAILEELKKARVSFGLDDALIEDIVSNKWYDKWFAIANGIAPINGENGEVSYLFSEQVDGVPEEDERGFVDYKERGLIRNTIKGTKIALITSPTQGKEGTSVRNRPLKQVVGKEAIIKLGQNTDFNENKSAVIAKENGNLIFKNGAFNIEKTIVIPENVDLTTGNIDFIGEVVVKGDVTEGFTVKGDGGVIVNGTVAHATIVSGKDLTIKHECIGSTITAKGKGLISFAESSKIKCQESLIGEAFMLCDIFCKGEIDVTKGKGLLSGGKIVATENITANIIGTKNFIKTSIYVGNNAILQEEKITFLGKIAEIDKNQASNIQSLEYLKETLSKGFAFTEDKKQLVKTITATFKMNDLKKTRFLSRIEEIDKLLQTKQYIQVICKKELYPGTVISINDSSLKIKQMSQFCSVVLGEDGIKINSL